MTNEQINLKLETYLRALDACLAQIPLAERSDIILELNGHITESLKTKSIDEVLNALGKPEQVANRYLLERGLQPIPKKRGGCFKWGCLGVVGFFLVLILAIVLLVRGFFPLIEVNETNERVRILGGLIDVDGLKETVKIGGLINVADDNSPTMTKEFPVGEFNKVHLDCSGDVEITQGSANQVVVQATQHVMDNLDVHVESNTLILDTKPNRILSTKKLKFLVTVKELTGALVDGSGDMHIHSLQTKDLSLTVEGSGDLRATALKAMNLATKIEGSGDMTLEGEVDKQSLLIQGSGDYKASELKTKLTQLKIQGSGDAFVNVDGALSVDIDGSGDVRYKGEATMSQSVAGSGTVSKVE